MAAPRSGQRLAVSLLSLAISGLLSGAAVAAAPATPPGLDHNNAPGLQRGPRGLVLVPDGKGGQKLDVPSDNLVSPSTTQPEADTLLDKNQLQHLEVQAITAQADGVKLEMGDYTGYIRVLAEDLVNVAIVPGDGALPESPAILKHDWEPVKLIHQDAGSSYRVKTKALTVEISKAPFGVRILDAQGKVINEDDTRFGTGFENGKPYVFKRTNPNENFYGFGEQSRGLNKRGDSIGMWNTDAYAYGSDTKYLYTTIPFFIGLNNGRAYGMLFDNTFRSYFEMASESDDYYYFYANNGPLSYYFFDGPEISDVIERYTELTGRFEQPPEWALGLHQSKWGYTGEEMLDVARTYREKQIPLDVIHMDIDYMDGYRVFTWGDCCVDPGDWYRWSGGVVGDPYAFHQQLDAMNVHTIAINDPGVKVDDGFSVYAEGVANDYFAKKPDGSIYTGIVWPGDSAFPDFTRQDVRDWWTSKHDALFDPGVDGIWLDMNEPGIFDGPYHTMPLDIQFSDGAMDHTEVHNVYGFYETEATAEAFKQFKPNQRPFILTRDMFAGSQRWAALWTGDNVSSWEHLKLSVPMNLNIGMSGIPMVGNDIGGFASRPTPELMARWIQLGALLPFSRIHYDSDAKAPIKQGQEPWAFGQEVEDIARRYVDLRYTLLPYLKNAFRKASETGSPIWQPLLLQFQGDEQTYDINDQFMLGERLLVAPVLEQGQTSRRVYLPKGASWTDFWTGERFEGGRWIDRDADLGTLPIFVRADSIIPSREVQQHTGEKPLTDLILDVWVDDTAKTVFYEDDGATLDYQKGVYDATELTVTRHGKNVTFSAEDVHDGYDSMIERYTLRIHDAEQPAAVTAAKGSEALPYSYDQATKLLEITVPAGDGTEQVKVRF